MNLHHRTVNVSRLQLLECLHANLATHQADYAQALVDCQTRLLADLKLAQKKVAKIKDVKELKTFRFNFAYPVSHEQDYLDIIELLEMSVDETIELDQQSFKAYVKNEWAWSAQFLYANSMYKSAGAFLDQ